MGPGPLLLLLLGALAAEPLRQGGKAACACLELVPLRGR